MSKIDYQDLSAKIMDNIGGVKNVKTVTHCVTRLRFYLHDRNIAEDSEIKKLPGEHGGGTARCQRASEKRIFENERKRYRKDHRAKSGTGDHLSNPEGVIPIHAEHP